MLGGGGGATAQTQKFPNLICRVAPWRAPHGPLRVPPAYGNPAFVRDHYTVAKLIIYSNLRLYSE